MKLKRLISCGLVGILAGVGILMNAKVSSAEDKSVTLNSDCLEGFKNSYAVYNDVKTGFDFEVNKGYKNSGIQLNNNKSGSPGCLYNKVSFGDIQSIEIVAGTVKSYSVYIGSDGEFTKYDDINVKVDTITAKGTKVIDLSDNKDNIGYLKIAVSGCCVFQSVKVTYGESITSYSVSFFDGAEEYTKYSTKVEENGKLIRPTDPEKEGYVFAGWYTNVDLTDKYDFDSPVKADLKLYAKFESAAAVETQTVTFMKDAETPFDTSVVKKGNTVGIPAEPTNDGYSFGGWYKDVNCTTVYDFNTPVNEDITLYAKWLAKYTVSFDTDGGSTVETQTVVTGNKATKPTSNPTKKGYNFIGWYTDNTYTTEFDFENTIITDNTTIYAKFEDASIFKLDGYTFSKINTLEELTTGYYVIGGFDNNNNSYYMDDKIGDGFFEVKSNPIAYVKIYEKNNKIKIQLNDLYIDTKAVKNKPYDFDVTNNRKDAHEFVPKMVDDELQIFVDESKDSNVIAMNVASNANRIKPYKKIATANSIFNITLFKAQNVKPFYVTFKGPNNEELNKEEMLPHQKAPEFEAPKKPGYKFMGWYNEATDAKYDFTTELSEETVLVAKYEALTPAELFEQLEIKNQLAYHWQIEDGTTYTIDNVSLRFGVNLTEEMKSLEGVKFGAILAKKVDVANINLSEYARECTSAAEVVAGDPNLKYLEFTNIAAEGGMTSLRLDNLDSAIAEEFVVVIYMEYNGKLYVTEQKIASVKVIASEYLKSDLEILKNEQIKGSLNQLSK